MFLLTSVAVEHIPCLCPIAGVPWEVKLRARRWTLFRACTGQKRLRHIVLLPRLDGPNYLGRAGEMMWLGGCCIGYYYWDGG